MRRLGKLRDIAAIALRVLAILFEVTALAILLYTYPRLKLLAWEAILRIRVSRLPPRLRRAIIRRYARTRKRVLSRVSPSRLLRQFLGGFA